MKHFRNATKKILRLVEERTGKRIELMPDASLGELSSLRVAKKGVNYHLLRYLPTGNALDYQIAFQAGFLLRMFSVPTALPLEFAPTGVSESRVHTLLTVGQALGPEDIANIPRFAPGVAQWALMSLRSTPIGMHVDAWIAKDYPSLFDLQKIGLARQQKQNLDLLLLSQGKLTIPTPFLAMPAAHALFVDKLLGGGVNSIPFEALGATGAGQDLLALHTNNPSRAMFDPVLVDHWARYLGMSDWYRWVPAEK